jgi:hypothetical protein
LARGAGAEAGVELEASGGVAASTSAEKLSDRCEASERDGFGAAVFSAVLAWMSDVTLNTLEPLAMNSTGQFSKERAKVSFLKIQNRIK